jgi:hypothetical protein
LTGWLVWQMRDEVEQLLDDDDDMAEMYLTEKRQKLEPPPESPLSTYSGVTSRTPRTPFGSAFTRNTLADASEADDGDSPPRLSRRDSRASRYAPLQAPGEAGRAQWSDAGQWRCCTGLLSPFELGPSMVGQDVSEVRTTVLESGSG